MKPTLKTFVLLALAVGLSGLANASVLLPTFTDSPTPSATPTPAGPAPIDLLSACPFAVLGGSGITVAGVSTTITGDVGSSTESGFGTVTLTGTNHAGDAITLAAQNDLVTAYNDGMGRTPSLLGATLGSTTVFPGVYNSPSGAFDITGTLILDGAGDTSSVFIFQTTAALVTAGNSSVVLQNSAKPENVFWVVGSSATLGANSTMQGTVLALTAIGVGNGTTVTGRVLARNAAVSLDTDAIINTFACPPPVGSPTSTPTVIGSATSTLVVTSTDTPTQAGTATDTAVVTMTATPTATPNGTFTASPTPGGNPAPVSLGGADGYSVLAGSGVVNTGNSNVDGYIGTFPTTTQSGMGTMAAGCTNHGGDTFTQAAKGDLNAAYVDLSNRPGQTVPVELGGTTLLPGVYRQTSMQLTSGVLLLDGNGNTNSVFVFYTGISTLTTANGGSMSLTNGAQAKNIYFVVGSSATIGSGSHLIGTIIAFQSITLVTGASVEGRLLALNGAVTVDTGTIVTATSALVPCSVGTITTTATPNGTLTATPTPNGTLTDSPTPNGTLTATRTTSPTPTPTPTATPSQTPGGTSTATPTAGTPVLTPVPDDAYFFPSPARGDNASAAYRMKEAGEVTLKFYNQTGRLVDTIIESKPAGWATSQVNVSKFASGTYYYTVAMAYASGASETPAPHKFVVLH